MIPDFDQWINTFANVATAVLVAYSARSLKATMQILRGELHKRRKGDQP